jgi:hypothetical protein
MVWFEQVPLSLSLFSIQFVVCLPFIHKVFNEDKSELYVDGRREGLNQHANVGVGCLDGLTIGADHRNDFPLGSTVESTCMFVSPL